MKPKRTGGFETASIMERIMRFPKLLRVVILLTFVMLTGRTHALELKIATLSPEGSSWMKEMREGAMEVPYQSRQ